MFKRRLCALLTAITLVSTLVCVNPVSVFAGGTDDATEEASENGIKPKQQKAFDRAIKKMGGIAEFIDDIGYTASLQKERVSTCTADIPAAYGKTDFEEKTIKIGTYQTTAFIEWTTYHEYAHAIGKELGLGSNGIYDQLFAEANKMYAYQYATSANIMPRNLCCNITPDEYFAEAFAAYHMNPKMLSTYCPYTYIYITKIKNIYENYDE